MTRMWRLDEFRFDEGIEANEVSLLAAADPMEVMSRAEAIALAHDRGGHLIALRPPGDEDVPTCRIGKLTLPLRWETVPVDEPALDERLWFEASCGGRDLLVPANGHTYPGRMTAYCPHDERFPFYSVSLREMGSMSDEARYFVAGFLSGNEPGPPEDEYGEIEPADLAAWHAATARFRRTGDWYGFWKTCSVCGCVLLPDTAADACTEHG